MPAPEHFRVTWSGVFGTVAVPVEIWSFGLSLSLSANPPATKAELQPVADAMKGSFAVLQGSLPPSVHLTRTRVARVGNDGLVRRDVEGAYVQADNLVSTTGSGSVVGHPPQVALAVTLQSNQAGPTGRGRFYLPTPSGTTLSGDLRLSVVNRDALLTAAKNFLVSVNSYGDQVGAEMGSVVIASGGSTLQGITPGLRPVTSMRLGRVLDTIQSRRNALEEDYASVTV